MPEDFCVFTFPSLESLFCFVLLRLQINNVDHFFIVTFPVVKVYKFRVGDIQYLLRTHEAMKYMNSNTAEGVGVNKKRRKNRKLHKHADQTIIIWEPFFNFSKIKSVSSIHAAVVFTFFGCLFKRKINTTFLLSSLKTLINFKYNSDSRMRIYFSASHLCHWSISVLSLLLVDISRGHIIAFPGSQAAFYTHSQGQK